MQLLDLPDEMLVAAALNLREPRTLRTLMSVCRSLHARLKTSRSLWRTLAIDLLGSALVILHATAWRARDDARFHRRLYHAAVHFGVLAYANTLRAACMHNVGEQAVSTTGHTATHAGHLVAIVGGWRPACTHPHLQLAIVDLRVPRYVEPALTSTSLQPVRRLRHSACAVRQPKWAARPPGAPSLPCVLVLGGCFDGGGPALGNDDDEETDRGEP